MTVERQDAPVDEDGWVPMPEPVAVDSSRHVTAWWQNGPARYRSLFGKDMVNAKVPAQDLPEGMPSFILASVDGGAPVAFEPAMVTEGWQRAGFVPRPKTGREWFWFAVGSGLMNRRPWSAIAGHAVRVLWGHSPAGRWLWLRVDRWAEKWARDHGHP